MNSTSLNGMLEATRLTRAGQLTEATALLQRMLQGGAAAPAAGEGATVDAKPAASPFRARRPMPALSAALARHNRGPGAAFSGVARPAPSAPPAGMPEGAQLLEATFSNEAGSRPYKLYVPSGYEGRPVPLIVMLHGCTQSPDDFAAGTRMNAAAEAETCLVVYPAQTAAANMSKCWNWFKAGDQQRARGEPSLIAGITREVMARYAVDERRVYVAGLSAGGAAAAIMGAAYPDLYAAIGVHSGLACGAASDLPSAFAAMQGNGARGLRAGGTRRAANDRRTVPAIVFHGDRDATVHPCNADDVIAQSVPGAPLEITVEEGRVPGGHAWRRTRHTDAHGETVLEQWVIHGAGHAWAGGSPAGSYTDPAGPDATREMMRFFLEHAHPAGPRIE